MVFFTINDKKKDVFCRQFNNDKKRCFFVKKAWKKTLVRNILEKYTQRTKTSHWLIFWYINRQNIEYGNPYHASHDKFGIIKVPEG